MRAAPKASARETPRAAKSGTYEKEWETRYLETIDGEIYLWAWALVPVKFLKKKQVVVEKLVWKHVKSTV